MELGVLVRVPPFLILCSLFFSDSVSGLCAFSPLSLFKLANADLLTIQIVYK